MIKKLNILARPNINYQILLLLTTINFSNKRYCTIFVMTKFLSKASQNIYPCWNAENSMENKVLKNLVDKPDEFTTCPCFEKLLVISWTP